MPKLDYTKESKTAQAIYASYDGSDDIDWRREHLGASTIGRSCRRRIWYEFRWISRDEIPGRIRRLFKRGHREEDWVVEDLERIGATVTRRQEHVDTGLPHFGATIDGEVLGIPEAPKSPHLLEVKTASGKNFRAIVDRGVRAAQPSHHAQMQIYMRGRKLDRALYIVINKETDEIYTERVRYVAGDADALVAKAAAIISSSVPPTRISEDPSWWECRMCPYYATCHERKYSRIERNCRTCAESTPEPDGTWSCALHKIKLSIDDQRRGCKEHLAIPQVVDQPVVAHTTTPRSVTYTTIIDRDCKFTPR